MPDAAAAPRRGLREHAILRRDVFVLASMYVLAVIVYALLGTRQPVPLISPDELTYGHLASSIASGDGFTWRGGHVAMHAPLYIFFLVPSWLVSSGVAAYGLAKLTGALLLPTVALPVWLLARALADRRTALLSAGLSLAGVWMCAAGFLITENLAIPLGVAALAAMVAALRAPGSRWGWLALAASALAAYARLQLAVLFGVFAAALLLDVARARPDWRARLAVHRRQLVVTGLVVGVGGVAALAASDAVLGRYSGVTNQRPELAHAIEVIGQTSLGLVAMTAFFPAILWLSFVTNRPAWRDEIMGPLLAVTLPATVLITIQAGWYTAGTPVPWHIDRYVAYLAPLLITTALVGVKRGFVSLPRVAGAGLLLAASCLTMPPLRSALEERSYFTTSHRVHQIFGTGDAAGFGLACLLVGLVGLGLLARSAREVRTRRLAVMIGFILVIQTQAAWNWQITFTRALRTAYPSDLAWLSHDVDGDVAQLLTDFDTPTSSVANFFSPNVTRLYRSRRGLTSAGQVGRSCAWSLDSNGSASFQPQCGPTPHRFYLDTLRARLTFRDEKVLADRGPLARVVEVHGQPQLAAYINDACNPAGPYVKPAKVGVDIVTDPACTGVLTGYVFPRSPASLRVQFRGGEQSHYVEVAGNATLIPARGDAIVTVSLPKAGGQTFRIDEDWLHGAGAPTVARADLIEPGHVQRVL